MRPLRRVTPRQTRAERDHAICRARISARAEIVPPPQCPDIDEPASPAALLGPAGSAPAAACLHLRENHGSAHGSCANVEARDTENAVMPGNSPHRPYPMVTGGEHR